MWACMCVSEDAHVWGAKGFHNHAIFLKCIHHKAPGESVRPHSVGSAYNRWQQLLVSLFTARLGLVYLANFASVGYLKNNNIVYVLKCYNILNYKEI